MTNRIETTAFALVDDLGQTLTAGQRTQIMALKHALVERGSYTAGTGALLYEAVTAYGVDGLASFEVFRQGRRDRDQSLPRERDQN